MLFSPDQRIGVPVIKLCLEMQWVARRDCNYGVCNNIRSP